MMKWTHICTWVLLVVGALTASGIPPCPLHYSLGSVVTARITVAEQRGLIPLAQGQDVQCYNYSLPYKFGSVPEVAIAVHDFQADATNDLFFSIKTSKSQSLSYVPLLVRTHWRYTTWRRISFSLLVEDRTDLESGYYQIDSGSLGNCEAGKTIQVILPYRNLPALSNHTNHKLFLHGFEISTQLYSPQESSPFELQIINSKLNSSGISIMLSVTTITQIQALHVSYVSWQSTNLTMVTGQFANDITQFAEISHIPESNIGRNYARIFGITGFVINHDNQALSFRTQWTGSKFVFHLDVSQELISYLSFQYIFFLGSQCSDCPNYPFVFNGTCRQYCPEGYHATGENVCIDCGDGHYWNGTACVKECPSGQFLNLALNECQCPAGLHWNGKICLSCPGGKIFNPDKNTCQCPSGTRWNGFGCATIETCTDGREWNVFKFMCECPQNSFWNGTFCVKIVTCRNGQIPDGNNGCMCPNGTHWNGEWCEPDGCTGGQSWNGSACECQPGYNFNGTLCLLCINGQVWNSRSKSCQCPANFTWNGNFCERRVFCSGKRVYNQLYQQCLCPDGTFWNGYTCMVQPECCCGKVWNQTTFQCNCPQSFNWDGTTCVLCLNGKVWDDDTSKCVCQPGTMWNGHFCVVIQECQGGMMWNQNTWSCQCPSVTVWNGNYCIQNPCTNGKVWDNIKRECLCPEGKAFIGGVCVPPESVCDNGKIWDPTSYKCVCPAGLWDSGRKCLPIPTCTSNQIYNALSNKCQCHPGYVWLEAKGVCGDPTCPVGERWDGSGCVAISCPPNSYYNGTECICPDPRDKCLPWEVYDGVRCVYVPGSCPTGTSWNGTYCAPDSSCPVGFYGSGSECSPLPQLCIPPTTWSNGRCSAGGSCPHGTYFKSGSCYPYVPCQNGQTWNDSLINCVCPEGTEWNGDRCIACSGGKTWEPFIGCVCPTGYYFVGSRCERIVQSRCNLIPNALWDGLQCVCHEGFDVVGLQCVCDGVISGSRCDRCAHRPNSEWQYGSCRCKQGYTLFGDECLGNQVGSDTPQSCAFSTFYDSQQKRCLPCPAGCMTCTSTYVCQVCQPDFNFDAASQLCIEHCGDGKRYILECDDANTNDGDGCSRDCRIQPGYTCRGGSPNSFDNCIIYQPSQVTIIQTGQIRYSSKIIVNVKLDYLPADLLQSDACNDRCSNILDGQVTAGDTKTVSIRSSYLAGTSYTFSVEIEFGRMYIGIFTLVVKVSPVIAQKYFTNVGTDNALTIEVNPAYLSLVGPKDDVL